MSTYEITQSTLDTYVNEDGEVFQNVSKQTMRTVRKVKDYDEFIMVYLKDMSSILKLDDGTQIKLLTLIWRDVNIYGDLTAKGNYLTIVKAHKEKWAGEIGVKDTTIANALSALVKKGLLRKTDRSIYELNPHYFFKGKTIDRNNILANYPEVWEVNINYELTPDKNKQSNTEDNEE